ncbi:MAG: ZIP family metal transporter [Bacilli bacterium]|nr:ZIP family metal transporter [Bacilli bacterium]
MNGLTVSILSLSLIFVATVLGSALVFFSKKNYSSKTGSIIVGLASGIMIATSFFGLLQPSIVESNAAYGAELSWLPPILGFILGALLLFGLDKIVPHKHKTENDETEGIKTNKISKNTKFILAVTLHNIPEGIAVGLVCGIALNSNSQAAIIAALTLAIGIAIQNFPEGSAVSIPLLSENISKPKAFLLGALTGIVEPIFGILALFLASYASFLLPYLLSFAAGAMIYVTIDELVPEFKQAGDGHFGIWSFIIGFGTMMLLEVLL